MDNRLAYGMIEDAFALAAFYAEAIAQSRCFNDGNKRTAFRSMYAILALNGIEIVWEVEEVGNRIILLARANWRPMIWQAG